MIRLRLLLLPFLAAFPLSPLRADPPAPAASEEVLTAASPSHFRPVANPWGGFDKDRAMAGQVERYIVVDDTGRLTRAPFPPGIDAADFLKRGVPDIVMIDGDGYFRYFPNSGTKEAPKFAEGIVLPVQLTVSPYQIQAVDYDGDGFPDLVLGDDDGYVYMLRNQGGSEVPRFDNPKKIDQVRVDITAGGDPWCNFVSPAYARWRPGASVMDLILGDGTYASDNIYYLRNRGSTERPKFEEKVVLITGDGRQHLTARACFWTGKDKPDLLVGERNGSVMLYPNNTAESDAVPKFKPGIPITAGGNARFAPLGRLAVADLNGDGKPDLLWGDAQGTVWFSLNTGTAEAPVFAAGTQVRCPDAPKPYAAPTGWTSRSSLFNASDLSQMGGFFYFLHVVGTNSQEPATFEPSLALPDSSPDKYVLKFEFMDPPRQITSPYPPFVNEKGDEGIYRLFYTENGSSASVIKMKEKTPYKFSCMMKGDGFSKFQVNLFGQQRVTERQGGREVYHWKQIGFEKDVSLSSSWQKLEIPHTFQYDKDADEYGKGNPGAFSLYFTFTGKGTFYVTDLSLKAVAK